MSTAPMASMIKKEDTVTDKVVIALIELQVKRKFVIKLINRQVNSVRALTRRYCGFTWDATEDDRTKINKRAATIVSRALANKAQDAKDLPIAEMLSNELELLTICLAPLEARRKVVEKEMAKLVTKLPVYEWMKGVAGLGEIGLAVIIGEAGDIGNYPNVRHLWRRLGLAPYGGRAMSNWHGNELTAEEWTTCGYSPRRRAEIYACVGDSLGKHQLGSAKKAGTDFSVAKGLYGHVYVKRRTHCLETHPDWTRGHAHDDAMRVMTKAVLKDLWRTWHIREGRALRPDKWKDGDNVNSEKIEWLEKDTQYPDVV